jgi:hypothetical protein
MTMKLKQVVDYGMDLTGKAAKLSAALMGGGFFAHALFYLVIRPFPQCGMAEKILCMVLPLVIYGAWLIMLRVIPVELSRVYGVLAACACLLLAVQGFFVTGGFGAAMGLVWYIICAAAYIFISFGFLPYRLLLGPMMLVPAAIRTISLLANLTSKDYGDCVYEASGLLVLLAIGCLSSILYRRK